VVAAAAAEALRSGLEAADRRLIALANRPKEVDAGRTLESILGDSGTEAKKAAKEIESLTDSLRSLEAAHFPLLAVREATKDILKTINEAEAKGIKLRVDKAELIRRSIRDQIGANKTIEEAAEEQEVLNNALRKGIILQGEFEFLSRKSAIAFLEGQRDATSGMQRAFLKLQQDATDSAAFTEAAFTDAFKNIEDAVVEFAQTGKISVNSFFRNFGEQLLRLGTQQAIAGIGSAFPMLGGPAGSTGGANAAGPGGLVASLFGGLFGFKHGGQFTVGAGAAAASLPGLDNRLVAFRARDNEEVTITPKNQGGAPMGGPTNIVFNVETKDADSFNRSQSQLQNRLLAGMGQARRRR
jgi:hypothetical protein